MVRFCCGIVFIAATLAASRRIPAVDLLRFPLAWVGVILALDGLARARRGSSPFRSATDLLATAAASVLFWDVFELVNLRLRNWWYVGVSPDPLAGGVFAAVSFATVLPAVRLGMAQLDGAEPRPGGRRLLEAGTGAGMLLVALAFPRYAFPLAWVFLWPVCEAVAGVRVPLRAMALGLPLGLLWESLNWRCARGWFYTVPFFDHPRLFEMPLPGYLGYLPFALEAVAALAVLDRLRPHLRGGKGLLALCAVALLHAASEHLARGQTVVSFSR